VINVVFNVSFTCSAVSRPEDLAPDLHIFSDADADAAEDMVASHAFAGDFHPDGEQSGLEDSQQLLPVPAMKPFFTLDCSM
jgi:hypothetical protein